MQSAANIIVDLIAPAPKSGAAAPTVSTAAPDFTKLLRGAMGEDAAAPLEILLTGLPSTPPAGDAIAAFVPLLQHNTSVAPAEAAAAAAMPTGAGATPPLQPIVSLPQKLPPKGEPAPAAPTVAAPMSQAATAVESSETPKPSFAAPTEPAPHNVPQTQTSQPGAAALEPAVALLGGPLPSSTPQGAGAPAASAAAESTLTDAAKATNAAKAAEGASAQSEQAASFSVPLAPTAQRPTQRGNSSANVENDARPQRGAEPTKAFSAQQAQVNAQPIAAGAVREATQQSFSGDSTLQTPTMLSAGGAAHASPTTTANEHAARAAPVAVQVAREIVRRFNGESTRFEVRLDPPELGRVEVRLEMTRDHRVTAVVAADTPQALTELARHARELEQTLQSAGLQLNEDGLSFDLRQSGHETAGSGEAGGAASTTGEAVEDAAPAARPIGFERWRGVRLDMMV